MSNESREPTDRELARTMAKVQHRHSEATGALAEGDVDRTDYELMQAFLALGDYLMEPDDWTVVSESEVDDAE